MIEYSVVLGPKVVVALGVMYSATSVACFWIVYITIKMVMKDLGIDIKNLLSK